jgi:hypothetical protein
MLEFHDRERFADVIVSIESNHGFYTAVRTVIPDGHPENTRSMTHEFTLVSGVPRWTPNQHVLFNDTIKELQIEHLPGFDREATEAARFEDVSTSVAAYRERMKNHKPSGEELFEMRAAFGRGTTVVNVITGRRTRL